MATSNIEKQSFGQAGAQFENGTAERSGDFCAITVIADAQFHTLKWDELTDIAQSGSAAHADRKLAAETDTGTTDPQTVPAGVTIYGQISKFKLHSGAVLAYFAA